MVSIDSYYGKKNEKTLEFMGLSTDDKPLNEYEGHKIYNASSFYEMDTKKFYFYDEENNTWLEQ